MENGFKAVQDFLRHPTDALFAFNDVMAIGFMAAAQRKGIHIPNDVKVVGFDDILMSALPIPSYPPFDFLWRRTHVMPLSYYCSALGDTISVRRAL